MDDRIKLLNNYYKWKSIATVGLWIGIGIVAFNGSTDAKGILGMVGLFTTFIIWIAGSSIT
ncbi:MAG: hypothetical protein PHW73_10905 [Atribacterota bacterium]|nr:hypothetical protein [Atribacterota bacterium]